MDPDELEFIGEKIQISVIPNFSTEPIHLISGSIGPFRAGLPVEVPLWLACHMRQQLKCRIVPPIWMDRDTLEDIKEEEKRVRNFTNPPCPHYMVVSKLMFSNAADDVPNLDEIKTLIKDIFDIRSAKLRSAIDSVIDGSDGSDTNKNVNFDNVSLLELHTVRPFLPHALDLVSRLERVAQLSHTNNTLTSNNVSSNFGNNSYR